MKSQIRLWTAALVISAGFPAAVSRGFAQTATPDSPPVPAAPSPSDAAPAGPDAPAGEPAETGPGSVLPAPGPPPTVSPSPAAAPGVPSALSREEQRLDAYAARLTELRETFSARVAEERSRSEPFVERLTGLSERLRRAGTGDPEADRVYSEIVSELMTWRPSLRSAIVRYRSASEVPRLEALPEFGATDAPRPTERLEALRARAADLRAEAGDLARVEQAARLSIIKLRGNRVRRLNNLRLEALPKLSRQRRAAVLGISRDGIAQLRRETDHLDLSARLYALNRAQQFRAIPELSRDAAAWSIASYTFFKVITVCLVYVFFVSRGGRMLAALRAALFRRTKTIRSTRRVQTLVGLVQSVLPWLGFLVFLRTLKWALGPAAAWPESQIVYDLAFLYGLYRLLIDFLMWASVKLSSRYRLYVDAQRRRMILRSVRTFARAVFGIAGLLTLSEFFLGRGYLYNLVVRLAWVVILLAVFRILNSWRSAILDAYLKINPEGILAKSVTRTRERWYGIFVGSASLVWLAGHAVVVLARDFALGFDQTRKALAFLVRRRMEKQAERQGYAEGKIESLPPALIEAFSEKPARDDSEVVGHFPGTDRLASALSQWREKGTGGGFLLIGEQGMGRTTWLSRVNADGLPVTRSALARRVRTPGELAAHLASELLPGESDRGDSLAALGESLRGGEPRMVTLDDCENLFLSTVGGYAVFEGFVSLLEETWKRVFWVCSVSAYAWEHLVAVRPDLVIFRHRQLLEPWSEEQIGELIRIRNRASGIELTYEDLVLNRMEGITGEARLLETEESYTRLLWDYSNGNPRVALHFWLHSLVAESPHRARVRLFRAPAEVELEGTGEKGHFLLAAIVLHENLTRDEAVAVTRFPEAHCRIHLERFLDLGVLQREEDRYHVTTHWHGTVVRVLRRRNLLPY